MNAVYKIVYVCVCVCWCSVDAVSTLPLTRVQGAELALTWRHVVLTCMSHVSP